MVEFFNTYEIIEYIFFIILCNVLMQFCEFKNDSDPYQKGTSILIGTWKLQNTVRNLD
jgi:hypothetical protein